MSKANPDLLIVLAERCRNAAEHARMLDGEIAKAMAPDRDWRQFNDCWGARCLDDDIAFEMPPAYTKSLDAARSLVPQGRSYILRSCDTRYPQKAQAMVFASDWSRHESTGETEELALCAASLQAQAHDLENA